MADGLELENQVCFALYSATRAVTQLYRPVLDALGLTYPQYLVMLVLWECGPVSVKRLGEELALDSGTLSPLLKRLEAHGCVRRERSTVDERSVLVHLTAAGAALRARACGVPCRIAGATGMPLVELDALRQNLVRLTESVTAHKLTPEEGDQP
ncbi:MarR family winged helix-turn-helix transcriptional regulator [Actinophytocola oryzae]|uniref:DNA-binding MarR family transcriptional regulator n=1 Tax=Actinophytocola oryzae TaxID=502181 RepID=A0A4R7VUZ2_9PSEU|nr:MarR family transcriptional regulator [Actinophytocola oryzae]TDV53662.1 DNA-binding MarR family transcriptional regulator [Actinophytocola oryzae]